MVRDRILSGEGYFQEIRELANAEKITVKEAWRRVEERLAHTYGLLRYKEYDNFRKGCSRWHKRHHGSVKKKPKGAIVFYEA